MPSQGNAIVNEILGNLQHSVYDPVKAHEYYERHKHLKGRQPGDNVVPLKGRRRAVPAKGKDHPNSHKFSPALEARIHHLEHRLDLLRSHLAKLLASKHKKSTTPKHETAAQKQKKAAASKKYQQTHKSELAAKRKKAAASKKSGGGGSSSSDGISNMTETQLRAAIKQTQINLHEAVAKARAMANRGTA